ncbi:hypothetical protein Tco_0185885 [Tanacetum coccineum]
MDEECTFPSENILGYTSTLPNYFPATLGNISYDFSENYKNDKILPVFLPFYNNPYLKDMQAFYAKESPILPSDPITPPAILTPSLILPPSLLSTTPPPDYPFDESIFAELDNSLWIIPLGSEPVPEESNKMPPKKTSTSAAPAMTQATIRQLVADSVVITLEAQAATLANTDNSDRNFRPKRTPIARKCTYEKFMI